MGFSKIIIGLCFLFCFVVSSSVPQKIWAQEQTGFHGEPAPTMARKLMHHLDEEAKVKGAVGEDEHNMTFKIKEQTLPGREMHNKEEDRSEFESMDYDPETVKKRNPVHNK